VAVDELDDDPVTELDLDEAAGAEAAGAEAAAPERGRWRTRWAAGRPMVAVALAGALVGGGLVHAVESVRRRGETAVSVALGEEGGGLLNRRLGSRRVIRLSTVALNEGPSVVTIRGVRVVGDGAGLTRTFSGEASIYPFQLAPGETGNMPLALTADCDVRAPQAPGLQVDVTAADGTQRTIAVRVPGLDELWRRATTPEACSVS
jgi:hypothetical protein